MRKKPKLLPVSPVKIEFVSDPSSCAGMNGIRVSDCVADASNTDLERLSAHNFIEIGKNSANLTQALLIQDNSFGKKSPPVDVQPKR